MKKTAFAIAIVAPPGSHGTLELPFADGRSTLTVDGVSQAMPAAAPARVDLGAGPHQAQVGRPCRQIHLPFLARR